MAKSVNSQSGLEIVKLVKKFGSFTALNDINLQVKRGEFLTLLGPSGSGKTTLLMSIAGFETPSEGVIHLDNHDITHLPAQKRDFGMVFQGYALFPHMSVAENIAYPLEVRKIGSAQKQQRVAEMLKLVQLEEFADRLPKQLSGGQQQRVALARALSFEPQILLLDEPLGALDKKLRMDVQRQLKEIHAKVKTTFIYVTHDQEEALSMSDRIVIMRLGEIVQIGTPLELYEKPDTVFTADFLGKSNFIHGVADKLKTDALTYKIGKSSFTQKTPKNINGKFKTGERMTIALRPEKIDMGLQGKLMTKMQNKASGVIDDIAYFGSMISLTLDVEDLGKITIDIDAWRAPENLQPKQAVDFAWYNDAGVIVKE